MVLDYTTVEGTQPNYVFQADETYRVTGPLTFDTVTLEGGTVIKYDVGAKISEHGKGNALDIRALRLANGQRIELTDPQVPHSFRAGLRESVCARFTTVLGPGSDGMPENHFHMDLGRWKACR